ncbi:hypothetical protein GCM10028857_26140 [Salinarchaeum chitinilyticum]
MTSPLTLDEITALLLEKFEEKGGERLPPTAHNKLVHFIEKGLEENHVEHDLPLFWYMFGRVTAKSNSSIYVERIEGDQSVKCDLEASDISASEVQLRTLEKEVEGALGKYFETDLETLVRSSYDDAPYDAQRTYLDLKDQLESEANSDQATFNEFASSKNRQIRELLYQFVQEFPLDDFPEYEQDLNKWYRLISGELDSDDFDPETALRLTEQFWRLFCLELACVQNNGLTPEEIAEELRGVESIESEKQDLRNWIFEKEKVKTRRNARVDKTALRAASAMISPKIEAGIDS